MISISNNFYVSESGAAGGSGVNFKGAFGGSFSGTAKGIGKFTELYLDDKEIVISSRQAATGISVSSNSKTRAIVPGGDSGGGGSTGNVLVGLNTENIKCDVTTETISLVTGYSLIGGPTYSDYKIVTGVTIEKVNSGGVSVVTSGNSGTVSLVCDGPYLAV